MGIKCYMIEPIYGADISSEDWHREWPPMKYIVGYRNPNTEEERENLHEFAPGAMWYATWMPKNWCWDDETEPHLIVKCPTGHDWDIDSRCNNCTLPNDRLHRCWVRHGIPPNITVDKTGVSCAAGAGSILLPGYHGFLQNGVFTS